MQRKSNEIRKMVKKSFHLAKLLLLFIFGQQILSEECISNLNKHIKYDLKPHQVVLLAKPDSISENVITGILQGIPHLKMNVNEMSPEDLVTFRHIPSFYNPRGTSLFLIINSSQNTKFNISSSSLPLRYVMELWPSQVRPKVIDHEFY